MTERKREFKPLISIAECADMLQMSRTSAYAWAHTGCLPGLVVLRGHRMVVRRIVLEKWLRGEEVPDARDIDAALRVVGQ